jgi:hypothetical protein
MALRGEEFPRFSSPPHRGACVNQLLFLKLRFKGEVLLFLDLAHKIELYT